MDEFNINRRKKTRNLQDLANNLIVIFVNLQDVEKDLVGFKGKDRTTMEQYQNLSFAHECKIRDLYSEQLAEFRPNELVVKREASFQGWTLRADLRTVDHKNVLREWEFKICADYSSLGQILTYTALMREQLNFGRVVQGVIAAFEIPDFIIKAIQINNLGIELVHLPAWMAQAGNIPLTTQELSTINIPRIPNTYSASS